MPLKVMHKELWGSFSRVVHKNDACGDCGGGGGDGGGVGAPPPTSKWIPRRHLLSPPRNWCVWAET